MASAGTSREERRHCGLARATWPLSVPKGAGSGSTSIGTWLASMPSAPRVTSVPSRVWRIASCSTGTRSSLKSLDKYIALYAFLEGAHERLAVPREHADVAAHGDEKEAALEHAARLVLAHAEETRRLAGSADALAGIEDRRLHLRVLRVGEMAHIGGEVGRADEDAVDALGRGDGGEVGNGLARLALHEDADLLRRALGVIGDAAVAVGPRRAGKAADALRRIARRRDGAPRFFGRLHEGKEQRARADVEQALDDHRLVPGHAHHRLGGAALGGAQMMRDVRQLVGRMLHVEEQPVEAGACRDFGRRRAGEAHPQADLRRARSKRALEAILRH